jgi:23S rRNA (guanosine2251-2'-O)-methyltransferase
MKNNLIYGLHPLMEAIKSGQHIDKVFLQKGLKGSTAQELRDLLETGNIPYKIVPLEKMNRFTKENHQGVVAFISPVKIYSVEDLLGEYAEGERKVFLLLDGITDPRNLGAIIRTAAATDVSGVILPENNSAPLNEDVVKTSAGGIFKVPIARTKHLADAIFFLQSSNIPIYAATEKANKLVYEVDLSEDYALVMGSEGKGIQRNIIKLTDLQCKLPMSNKMQSLNVSVAAGVILYEGVRQKLYKK